MAGLRWVVATPALPLPTDQVTVVVEQHRLSTDDSIYYSNIARAVER